jgi:hypothetical protein
MRLCKPDHVYVTRVPFGSNVNVLRANSAQTHRSQVLIYTVGPAVVSGRFVRWRQGARLTPNCAKANIHN